MSLFFYTFLFAALFLETDLYAKSSLAPARPLVIYVHEIIYSAEKERLEKNCEFPFMLKPFSGAGLLSRILIEGNKSKADVVLGLEGEQAFNQKVALLAKPLPRFLFDKLSLPFKWDKNRFLPLSYAYLAFLSKGKILTAVPNNKRDFLNSLPSKSLVMPDPRTSMVGRGGLSWIEEEGYETLHKKVLTYPKGWSGACALFQRGRVPVMLSYTTSVLYHHSQKDYEVNALIFQETPHPVQVMTAFMLKKKKEHPHAVEFLTILLSPEMQKGAQERYSYPVTSIDIPPEYEALRPPKAFLLRPLSPESLKAWVRAGYKK